MEDDPRWIKGVVPDLLPSKFNPDRQAHLTCMPQNIVSHRHQGTAYT